MKNGLTRKTLLWFFPLLSLFSILIALLVVQFSDRSKNPGILIRGFNKTLNENFTKAEKILSAFPFEASAPQREFLDSLAGNLPDGFSLYLFTDEIPVYWSDNDFLFDQIDHDSLQNGRIFRFTNGYFQVCTRESGKNKLLIADLIKHEYPYENDYLQSAFGPSYNLPSAWSITVEPTGYPVKSPEGEFLLYIEPTPVNRLSNTAGMVVYGLYLFAFVCLILGLYHLYLKFTPFENKRITIFLFIADVIIMRAIIQLFRIPSILDETELYNAVYYASSRIFPSLGDLFTTAAGMLVTAVLFYRYYDNIQKQDREAKPGTLYSTIAIALTIALFFFSCYLIETIWVNSTLQLDFSKILEFTAFSFAGFLIIALILISFFLISFPLLRDTYSHSGSRFTIIAFLLITILFSQISSRLGLYSPDWKILILLLFYIFLLIRVYSGNLKHPSVVSYFFIVLILTSVSSYSYYHNRKIKENSQRKLMAVRLSSDRDKIAEYLFAGLEEKLIADTLLRRKINESWYSPAREPACTDYILQTYFRGFWTKYNSQVTLCFPEKTLIIKPSDYIINCHEYFDGIISQLGEKTTSDNFYYIRESYDEGNYIARVPILQNEPSSPRIAIVIELMKKYAPKGLGYPELLLDRSQTGITETGNYSWAIYSKNELVKNVGDYSYSIYESAYKGKREEFRFFDKNGYNHLFHAIDDDSSIIISRKADGLLDILAPFTYQITFHVLLVFLIFAVLWLFRKGKKRNLDLSTRLQVMLIILILFASALIGFTILENIKSLNAKKNRDMLSEKAHSVLIELEHKLATMDILEKTQQPYLEELLTKFSQVFFTDINLYNTDGSLLASSRAQIFDEGLKSVQMNSDAFKQLAVNKRTMYITNEQIGNYNYLSAYIPFRNDMNKLTAYINLPYFARQQELRQEISAFLVAFINIYVILTAIAVVVSLLVGSYLTRPLQLIRERFSSLNLGKRNEKIDYNRQDELGDLINEYNNMVEKLTESAERLARSERESAWREMARQVAHEIKNPLTPMKLSIQHLIKSWHEQAPDWDKRFERTSKTLIQQIDSLSSIATAFSDFAKLPQANNKKVELTEVIRSTMGLFTEHPEIDIILTLPEEPCHVFADEKQLSRVFINLLNNSVQAIPAGKRGIINITLVNQGDTHIVSIRDNGTGIGEEQKSRIFSPNFTTKSAGMGLGLAMVKNIINSAGGDIRFTSASGHGTTFIIELPALKN
ncbi:MAG: ATP-binding protein [Lentimicrobium sp.]|uniref:sensor histidine kinase n=1 Tax=Lentimicrobium sp. TaxID=2034841 RepID=UPI0025E6C848|nr:ATP-binding protein [Lentimicrobium sp.]MCO5256816.1 ATP-binding protein [Lentimicrobium sp.]